MGSMTENIADKAINDTRIVKQFTNPVKEPIDSDINLFDLLDNRAKRDPEGAMIEYKGDDGTWHQYIEIHVPLEASVEEWDALTMF